MVQGLRALAALSEDSGSIPSIYVVARNSLLLQFQGIRCPLLASTTVRYALLCIYTQSNIHLKTSKSGMLVHAFILSTWEAEVDRSL